MSDTPAPGPTDKPTDKPTLLFYCQHALGLGHLVRSLALADALAAEFQVVLLNGGRFPDGTSVPAGVRVVNLPPLGHDPNFQLVSHDEQWTVEEAMQIRRATILRELVETVPAVVLVELFPFGRKKFEFELLPLLDAVHAMGADRPRVVCSVRDILVGDRPDQEAHDERASTMANRYFDAILVHADPQFARLEETFKPATPLAVPVHYTGFVTNDSTPIVVPDDQRVPRVLVSAGGGMVGGPLFRVVVEAHRRWHAEAGLETLALAGPFAPDADWAWLQEQAASLEGFTAVKYLPDLRIEMARSAVTVSQVGYNTTMDILRAKVPAVVIPYAEGREDEQRHRGRRLDALGVVRCVDPDDLDVQRLADAVLAAATSTPASVTLDLTGRDTSARMIAELCRAGSPIGAGA
jgi:predicted glycosyltransferase